VLLHARAATFTVTSAADTSDPGTLRNAITQANADTTTPRLIDFNIPGGGVQTITLGSALPTITKFMSVDATTQPGYAGAPLVVVDGNSGDFDGLTVNAFFTGNSNNKTFVKGLCIVNCGTNGGTPRNGINLVDGDSVTVSGCYLGVNATGNAAARNTGAGIRVELAVAIIGGATAADRNVISGNGGAGIDADTDTSNQASAVTITGNYIGVSADGMSAIGNGGDGIFAEAKVTSGATKIGGSLPGEGNVISSNGGAGIRTARGANIQQNIIGLAADGVTASGNLSHGVSIEGSASVLDGTSSQHNIISANGGVGVQVTSASTSRSTIRQCYIGTDVAGMLARGNASPGVQVAAGSASIGSCLISANGGDGVRTKSGDGNITLNTIGLTKDLNSKLGNGGDGVVVENVPNLTIDGNTIGGNPGAGIHVTGASATGLKITSNVIGTRGLGSTLNLGNGGNGVTIDGGAQDEIVGSLANADSNANQISFNGGIGIVFPLRTRILINRIYSNVGLAMDRGGDGVDAPSNAPAGGRVRVPDATTINPAALNSVKVNSQFNDRVDISYSAHQASLAGSTARIYFFGNLTTNRDVRFPVGFVDITYDANGDVTGTAQVILPATEIVAITDFVVTDIAGTSCSGEPAISTAIDGTTPPPPTVNNESRANHNTALHDKDPISTFTGELFDLESLDLNLGGPMPLVFMRYYASRITSDGNIASALGRNRLHNFDTTLAVDGNDAAVALGNGRVVQFTKAGSTWTLSGGKDVAFQLVESNTEFVFADPRSQRQWTFNAATKRLAKIEDGHGNAHTLNYDDNGKLASVSDDFGRTLAFAFDAGGKLIQVRDAAADAPNPQVREVNFTYSGADLVMAADALGQTTTYTYDGSGHLTGTQRPRGNTPFTQTYTGERVTSQAEHPAIGVTHNNTLAYDTSALTTKITDAANQARTHKHTTTGEATALIDEEGKTIAISSDAVGHRSIVLDRLGRTTSITYDAASGLPATIAQTDGTVTTLDYKARKLSNGIVLYDLVRITFPDRTTRAFAYDARGNISASVDELGKTTKFAYNSHGQLLTVTNPAGGVLTLAYDEGGNLASSTDSDAGIGLTTYSYDEFSRLTQITFPAVAPAAAVRVALAYDAVDRIVSITDELDRVYGVTYDANGNVSRVTDPAGKQTEFSYDDLDRLTAVLDRLNTTRSRTFDPRNQVASVTDELMHTTTFGYDSRRRPTMATTPENETFSFGYNDEAAPVLATDPLLHTTGLLRNKRDGLIGIVDGLGHVTQFERDELQRVTRAIDPVGRVTALSYDKRGQLASTTRAGTGAGRYSYDAANRLAKIVDPNGGAWSLMYSPWGRMTGTKDPLGRESGIAYDARGRIASTTLPEGGTAMIEHDAANNVTRLQFPNGPDLQFGYDALNRLLTANGVTLERDAEGEITKSTQSGVDFSATYDAAGRLVSVAYGTALTVGYTYDNDDRLLAVQDNAPGANNSVTFAYDAAGRITTITRSNGVNSALTFDAANRLTRIRDAKGSTTILDLQYKLNADGDVTSTDFTAPLAPAVTAGTRQFQYDVASQVKSAGFTYDARGRLTAMPDAAGGPPHTLTWDGASRLTAVDSTTLAYDGLGDVITRTAAGTTTRYFYQHAIARHPLVAERAEATMQFTRFYVWTPDGRLLYAVDPATGAPSFYHFDRTGNTLALSDANGAVTDAYSYTPEGEQLAHIPGTSTQPFTFVGALGIRREGPLYQMRARYYDSFTGRFISRDPRGPRLDDPRKLDPYLYALGNPARYVDPSGEAEGDGYFGVWFAMTFLQTHGFIETSDDPMSIKQVIDGKVYPILPEEDDDQRYGYVKTNVVPPSLPNEEVFVPTMKAQQLVTAGLNAAAPTLPAGPVLSAGTILKTQPIPRAQTSSPVVDHPQAPFVRIPPPGGGDCFLGGTPLGGAALFLFGDALANLPGPERERVDMPTIRPGAIFDPAARAAREAAAKAQSEQKAKNAADKAFFKGVQKEANIDAQERQHEQNQAERQKMLNAARAAGYLR
jgi:RHS repeat-associated protein